MLSPESFAYLNIPGPLPETVETKLVSDFSSIHGIGQVLLIGKNEEKSIAELILIKHPLQFLSCFSNTLPIVGIHDENDTLGILKVYVQAVNGWASTKQ
jgi:hypothetical protein